MDWTTTPADTGQPQREPYKEAPPKMKLHTSELSDAMRPITAIAADPDSHNVPPAPATPSLHTPLSRRASQAAVSPLTGNHSPRQANNAPMRRPSSSASVSRPPSSPRLVRKGSRSSLGGSDEQERRPTPKRSISNLIAGLREAQSTMEIIEEPIPLTAPQIAMEHFMRELMGHTRADADAETIVILHDACYGHRFSRLKTTKASLSMIVERPERLHASILGASTAYVRLGEHHAGGRQAPHPERNSLSKPPFMIRRSARIIDITSPFVTSVHGTAWMSELQQMCHAAPEKLAAGATELSRSTTPGEPEKEQLHQGDLYLATESLNAFQGALGGVADAVDIVFADASKTKRAFVAVRPPGHHCSAEYPSGFCWLNNVHVGIEYAAQTYGLTHAAILDFDLHHGDGSQSITWERNSKNNVKRMNAKPASKLKLGPDIGYYSIHDINSYPCEMGDDEKVQAASICVDNAHGQSIWNVHLQPWKTEADFWKLYEEKYCVLLDKAKLFLEYHSNRLRSDGKVRPKAAIFISAGFDASEWEGEGMQRHKVNVPTEFYARFTQDVVKLAQTIEGCEGRVISVLEGGYSDRALCSGVLSHLSGLCVEPSTFSPGGVGSLLEQMNGLSMKESLRYERDWWSAANLTALENKVNPPPPPQGKKVRTGPQPTYATPTESFAYKVLDPQRFARSISGTMREGRTPTRPPTPPPPEVDWVVATQELSKLLIPTDRQTKSFAPEELAVPRAKKERHSGETVGPMQEAGQPRQLRDRKAKLPTYAETSRSDEVESVRSVSRAESRASRRETIAVLPSEESAPVPQRRASRRLSAGSTLSVANDSIDSNAPPVPSLPKLFKPTGGTHGPMNPPPVPAPAPVPNNKKLRAPSKPRKSPPPAVPAAGLTGSVASSAQARTDTKHEVGATAAKPSDVDSLTSGMKRITLKMSTTKEEHDRKQKEKLDADRKARALKAAETRRVNAAAKKTAKDTGPPATSTLPKKQALPLAVPKSQTGVSAVPPPLIPPMEASTAVQVPTAVSAPSVEPPPSTGNVWTMPAAQTVAGSNVLPANVGPYYPTPVPRETEVPAAFRTPAEELELPEYSNGGGSSNFSPALIPSNASTAGSSIGPGSVTDPASTAPSSSPEPPPHVAGFSGQGAYQIPINKIPHSGESTSRPTSSGRNLPVFSSTGPIPFGTVPGSTTGNTMLDGQAANSIWDVPDSPAK